MLHSDERIQVKGCILYWSPSFNRCQSQMSLGQLRCGWKSKIESTAATRCQKGTVLNTRGSCSGVVFNFAIQCTVIDLSDVRPLGQRADCVKSFFSCGKGFFFFIFLLTLFVLWRRVLLHYKLCSVNFGSTVWNTPLWKLHEPWSACRCLYRNRYIGGDLGRTVTA